MRRLVLLLVLLALPVGHADADARPGFRWPLAGSPTVVRGFEPPQTRYGTGHRGVDLAGSVGETVRSAGPGRVTYAGVLAGRGVVTVTHGGLRTTYEPVTAQVRVGELVHAGTPLGSLVAGHASCGARTTCLHWGLLRGETYLDPLGLLQPPQVRLLPLGDAASTTGRAAAPAAAAGRAAAPATAAGGAAARARVTRASETRPPTGTGRSVGGVVATAALVAGVGLLLKRPTPPGTPPRSPSGGTLVDLRAERRRRRAA